jgi:Glu-tRNAGln amidotransferase C subunit
MLKTLNSQLHFVREIQKLKTHSVNPLKCIRDESAEADLEREIGYEELKGALESGSVDRKYSAASRKGTGTPEAPNEPEDWDVLKQAERKAGRYFIVETGKK